VAVFPDRIVLKNSTDSQAAIEAAIATGGTDAITQGEIVLGIEPNNARFYTKAGDGSIVSLGSAAGAISELGDLVDVDLDPPATDGQVIAYNATTGNWEPVDQAPGVTLFRDLDDVVAIDNEEASIYQFLPFPDFSGSRVVLQPNADSVYSFAGLSSFNNGKVALVGGASPTDRATFTLSEGSLAYFHPDPGYDDSVPPPDYTIVIESNGDPGQRALYRTEPALGYGAEDYVIPTMGQSRAYVNSRRLGDLADVDTGIGSAVNYTSFDPGQPALTDPAEPPVTGEVDTSLGTNAYKVVGTPYGDGSYIEDFLGTEGRYDIVNLKIRSDLPIDGDTRFCIGGNKRRLEEGAGFTLYTRDTGFSFYGNGNFTEFGTRPEMAANQWHEITYVLDWGSAQRATTPTISLWVNGEIAADQAVVTATDYLELTGSEATRYSLSRTGSEFDDTASRWWDEIRVATGNTVPWGLSDATIANVQYLMDITYTDPSNAPSDGQVLAWSESEGLWMPADGGTGGGGGGGNGGSGAGIYLTETQTASNGTADFVGLGYSGILQKVTSDLDAWIVLYSSAGERAADAGRAFNTDSTPGSGVLFEAYVTAGGVVVATPGTTYMNNDATLTEAVYAAVRDQAGANVDATVTFSAYGLAAITAVNGGTFGSGL